jgi:hypothetical protein
MVGRPFRGSFEADFYSCPGCGCSRLGGADPVAGGVRQAAELFGRQHDGYIAALALDADRLGLRHVDEFAETVLGIGGVRVFIGRD